MSPATSAIAPRNATMRRLNEIRGMRIEKLTSLPAQTVYLKLGDNFGCRKRVALLHDDTNQHKTNTD